MAYVDGELYVKVWVVIMGVYALQMLLVPAKMTTDRRPPASRLETVVPEIVAHVSENRPAPQIVAYPKTVARRKPSRIQKPSRAGNRSRIQTPARAKHHRCLQRSLPPRSDFTHKSNKHMEFWIRGASVGFGGMAYLMTLIDTEKAVQVGTAASFAIGVLYPRSAGVRFPRGGARRDARRLGGTPSTAT